MPSCFVHNQSERKPVLTDAHGLAYGPENPLVMAGAGLCKEGYATHIAELKQRGADAVVIGSITLEPRVGNTGRCEYFDNPQFGLNA